MTVIIPASLAENCRRTPAGTEWLGRLPTTIRESADRWGLRPLPPFERHEPQASWVAPVVRSDGSSAVLKLGMPHMEARHELQGLRFWDGVPTVRLLAADEASNAMLLERCRPGTDLRGEPESEQDDVIAGLLKALWRAPSPPHPFRPLSHMLSEWSREARDSAAPGRDVGLLEEGLRLYRTLPETAPAQVLLATDLHAGNVLRAERLPWLAIDPKPFVGDPAYDATQHLLNCRERLQSDPDRTIGRVAELLELDPERVRLWTFARAVVGPRDDPERDGHALARSLAP